MTSEDLDIAYSEFCRVMTDIGKEQSDLFLARFALLSIMSIGDLDKVRRLIADAAAIVAPAAGEI